MRKAMANFEQLKYSKSQAKKAGKVFTNPNTSNAEKEEALNIINNWRASHSFPLQILYVHLRRISKDSFIVAQRLKRLHSITQKLIRFPNMSLTSMQDIGGCRIIVDSIKEVYNTVNNLKKSRMRHILKEEYDYLKEPKSDGYRSYHIVYSYNSDRNKIYNGLFIEIQVRTHIQHLWATAVETIDTFTNESLKLGRGSQESKEFFILVSKLLQLYEECEYDLDTIKNSNQLNNFFNFNATQKIIEKLNSIKTAVNVLENTNAPEIQGYYLLKFDRANGSLTVTSYSKKQIEKATDEYDKLEKNSTENENVVLVSTSSFKALKQAYPNYFADIAEFLSLMKEFLELKR